MQEDVLNSQRWLSLVFEGRNKEYGAYVHREESSDRHLKALILITVVALVLISLPKVINMVSPAQDKIVSRKVEVKTTAIETGNEVPDTKVIAPPALPKLKPSILFTPPVITASEIPDEELMKTQIELTDSKAAISIATVIDGDEDGVDIATLGEITGGEGSGGAGKKDEPRTFAEVMPVFPGGEAALMKWLSDNIRYPQSAIDQNIQGRVTLRFVVKSDGKIDQVEVLRGLHPSCDKEAVRVIKMMEPWIPGKQNGNPVSVYFSLPVYFKLNNY